MQALYCNTNSPYFNTKFEFYKKVPTIKYLSSENIIASFILLLSYHISILRLYYKAILANIRLRSLVVILYYKTFIIIQILCYKTFVANIRFWSIRYYNTCLYYKTFVIKIRLRSLRHKMLSGYVEHQAQLYTTKTQAHYTFQKFLYKQN